MYILLYVPNGRVTKCKRDGYSYTRVCPRIILPIYSSYNNTLAIKLYYNPHHHIYSYVNFIRDLLYVKLLISDPPMNANKARKAFSRSIIPVEGFKNPRSSSPFTTIAGTFHSFKSSTVNFLQSPRVVIHWSMNILVTAVAWSCFVFPSSTKLFKKLAMGVLSSIFKRRAEREAQEITTVKKLFSSKA